MRRVVTGHSDTGKSIITIDTTVTGVSIGKGKRHIQLWGSDAIPIHPDKGIMDKDMEWFPEKGGHRFFVWVLPPITKQKNNQMSEFEINKLMPGFLKHFEVNNPGMHTTNSVDCTYLISGEIVLELDDNVKIELKAGDSIIQNGTRHRWHNLGKIPATLITTCIGSDRIQTDSL